MDEPALYDLIYSGLARSAVYREAALVGLDLPDWVVPLSAVNASDFERIACELQIRPGELLLDLACGLGGPGLWVAQHTGACVTGVDCSPVAVECAAALAGRLGFEAAGLRIGTHEPVPDARERELRYFHALDERAGELRAEIAKQPSPFFTRRRIGLRANTSPRACEKCSSSRRHSSPIHSAAVGCSYEHAIDA